MKSTALLIACCATLFVGCGGVEQMSSDDLASAPLGGEYYGEGTLEKNTCDNPDPMSDAFKPFPFVVNLYPENEAHTSLTFNSGQIKMKGIMPVQDATTKASRFTVDYQTTEDGVYVYLMKLNGTIEAGEMNLEFYEGAYDGMKDDLGDLLCDASYHLHLKKILNYPYVKP